MPSSTRILPGLLLAAAVFAVTPGVRAQTASGAYLAALQAEFREDYAAAVQYYDRALADMPQNRGLLQNTVIAHVAMGDVAGARAPAEKLASLDPANQVAALVRLADALAAEDYAAAEAALAAVGPTFNPLLLGLVAGWIDVGREDFTAAQAKFDAMTANDGLAAYGQYHKALALALAGDFMSAEAILAGGPEGPLHLDRNALMAHVEILAQIDREPEALALVEAALSSGIPDPMLTDLRDMLASGAEVPFDQIRAAKDGAAEAYFTLAEALSLEESPRVALVQARLASHIRPDLQEARLLAAELLETSGRNVLAAEALAEVPENSPWFLTAKIRLASTQQASGDVAAGIATLEALAEANPDQIEVHSALGDAFRTAERFPDAVAAYSSAIERIETPQPAHWVLYYTRGISNERADDWEAAERDFRRALELQPDQPLVLNYLGYSLVEKGRNLDEALAMIEGAVAGQPDDGFITDSLGWVLYRLGRFDEAVPHMLRAVELVPDDPVVNDHLGDVLWKVGRTREAEFQWRRALSFGPAEELDMDRLREKLDIGLDRVLADEKIQDG